VSTSECVTNGIHVGVEARYSEEHSAPARSHWFFLYTITITNHGDETVQLLSRHWIITDAEGAVQEVQGEGVVGEQPVIAPGESFRYTSGATLTIRPARLALTKVPTRSGSVLSTPTA